MKSLAKSDNWCRNLWMDMKKKKFLFGERTHICIDIRALRYTHIYVTIDVQRCIGITFTWILCIQRARFSYFHDSWHPNLTKCKRPQGRRKHVVCVWHLWMPTNCNKEIRHQVKMWKIYIYFEMKNECHKWIPWTSSLSLFSRTDIIRIQSIPIDTKRAAIGGFCCFGPPPRTLPFVLFATVLPLAFFYQLQLTITTWKRLDGLQFFLLLLLLFFCRPAQPTIFLSCLTELILCWPLVTAQDFNKWKQHWNIDNVLVSSQFFGQ